MWLTPCRSSSSSGRSATSWLTRPRAAAPNRVRVLLCPVRPKSRTGIAIRKSPLVGPIVEAGGESTATFETEIQSASVDLEQVHDHLITFAVVTRHAARDSGVCFKSAPSSSFNVATHLDPLLAFLVVDLHRRRLDKQHFRDRGCVRACRSSTLAPGQHPR